MGTLGKCPHPDGSCEQPADGRSSLVARTCSDTAVAEYHMVVEAAVRYVRNCK